MQFANQIKHDNDTKYDLNIQCRKIDEWGAMREFGADQDCEDDLVSDYEEYADELWDYINYVYDQETCEDMTRKELLEFAKDEGLILTRRDKKLGREDMREQICQQLGGQRYWNMWKKIYRSACVIQRALRRHKAAKNIQYAFKRAIVYCASSNH